jgi:lipopolysaccharide assembly outer membrane protein LptD (OstA)
MVEVQTAMTRLHSTSFVLALLLSLLAPAPGAEAQPRASSPDTAARPRAPGDTSAVRADTSEATSPSGVDSVVTFTARDSVLYHVGTRTMDLYGTATIRYKELGLDADRVSVDWNTAELTAHGIPDSSDTTGTKQRGLPVLKDGPDTYNGESVAYNFRTRKGKIGVGRTAIDEAWYRGASIKKVDEDVMFVEDGAFTTCELETPHYHFGSSQMKLIAEDKIIARPVVMYVGDAPVMALPFGVFPVQRGRRSGLLTPSYGVTTRGRYISNLGYYWAIDDYLDLNFRGDVYSKGGYTFFSDFRYALRYLLRGSLSVSYGRVVTGEPYDPDYSDTREYAIGWMHEQSFDPTTRLSANVRFLSSTYYQNTSVNLNNLLEQNIVSNVTFMKSWEGTPFSLTANMSRDQNLNPRPGAVELTQVLPGLSFTMNQTYPFRTSPSGKQWYDLIGISYSGRLENRETKTFLETGSVRDVRPGVQHQVNVSASPKAGYITISPFLSYTEKWYDRALEQSIEQGSGVLATSEPRGFEAVRYYSLGINASTRLFGIVQPHILGINAIRHQLIPSLSYSLSPDFAAPRFGYYGEYTDTLGATRRYDRFQKSIFGGAPAGERQAINFSLGNVFEAKMAPSDTSGKEQKVQLLNLTAGVGYNFAADSLKFSEVGLDFRTSIADLLSIGGSSRFNLYAYEPYPDQPTRGRRVDKFLLSEEGRLWDLTAFSLSIGTRLSGERRETKAGPIVTEQDSINRARKSGFVGLYDDVEADFSLPWSLDLTWNFAQQEPAPGTIFRSSTLAARLGFNLTDYWKITASANYDILRQEVSAPLITVYRDLHCWELDFSWVPVGQYRNFRIEIRLKAPQLRDLKLTQQESSRGIY